MDNQNAAKRSFSLTSEMQDGKLILFPSGWLTAKVTEQFKENVKALLTPGGHVIVDMTGVTHVDSSGVGSIVSIHTSSKTVGCKFQICNLMGPVKRIFGLTRLLETFESSGVYLTKMP